MVINNAYENSRDLFPINLTTCHINNAVSFVVKNGELEQNGIVFNQFTSIQCPFVLHKDFNISYIYINEQYLLNNYEEVIRELIQFISKYRKSKLKILSISLINDNILKAIANNKNIMFITLGSEAEPYTLTRDSFDILYKSDNLFEIDCENITGEYSDDEKRYISWFNKKRLCYIYTYSNLKYLSSLTFDHPLNDLDIENLKEYVRDGIFINFNYINYDNIIKVIKALKHKNITFNLINNDKVLNFSEPLLYLISEGENIVMKDILDVRKFLEGENLLNLFVKDINNSNLSSYEKYIAVYKLVKDFKKYNNYSGSVYVPRDIYEILFNDYIVCTGYANLFSNLLKKVGIQAMPINIAINKESEDVTINDYATLTHREIELKTSNIGYHSRVLIKLRDDKYNINGIFIADPTWDSSSKLDLFNHALLTPFEASLENVSFANNDVDILNVDNSEAFFNKLKMFTSMILFLKEMMYNLDRDFYNYIENRYGWDVEGYSNAFYLELYNYVIEYTKKAVDINTFAKALKEVLSFVYLDITNQQLDEMVDNVIKNNKNIYENYFNNSYVR